MSGYSGQSGFLEDGSYVSEVSGSFRFGDEEEHLSFAISKNDDGVLSFIEIVATESDSPSPEAVEAARDFVVTVMSAALADARQEFFSENLFLYVGPHLDGEYWLPGFRLAPAIPEDGKLALINAERIASISFKVAAIDKDTAHSISRERSNRIAARLSLLLNVGFYQPLPEHRWVIYRDSEDAAAEGRRFQLGIAQPGIRLSAMPAKGEVCPLGKYEGSLDERYASVEPIHLPPESRRILRGLDSLDPKLSSAIDKAARLYLVGLVAGRRYPSVALAYRVAAIDAIAQASPEFSSFADFMRSNAEDEPDLEAAIDYLHGKARSAHFHSGEFPGGEFDLWRAFDPFMDDQWVLRSQYQRLGYELTRVAIVNWLRSIMADSDPDA